jgi:PilZ domain
MISVGVKEIREHKRKWVLWDATLQQDGRTWECKAIEISPGGVRIRIRERLTINSQVMLTIERLGNFPGEVRWQDEDFAGINFLEDAGVVQARLRGSVAAHHAAWPGSPSPC